MIIKNKYTGIACVRRHTFLIGGGVFVVICDYSVLEEVSLTACVIKKEKVPLIFYIMHVLCRKWEFISNVVIVACNFVNVCLF